MSKEITLRQTPHERVSMDAGLEHNAYLYALSERLRRAATLATLLHVDVMNGSRVDNNTISCPTQVQDIACILQEIALEAEGLIDELV